MPSPYDVVVIGAAPADMWPQFALPQLGQRVAMIKKQKALCGKYLSGDKTPPRRCSSTPTRWMACSAPPTGG